MKIKDIIPKINPISAMQAIALNEVGNNPRAPYRFSYAGGKSGYSFGRSQFDVTGNPAARNFLKGIGFSDKDIERLLSLDPSIDDLTIKLQEHKKEIDDLDLSHIKSSIEYLSTLIPDIEVQDSETFIHLLDYHNQLFLSYNGQMHKWLKEKGEVITPEMVLKFKLNQKWGQINPQDVKRRYNNIKSYWNK